MPCACCSINCGVDRVSDVGFEAIRTGKGGITDGLVSGLVLGAAWRGFTIVSDRSGLSDQVRVAARSMVAGSGHATSRLAAAEHCSILVGHVGAYDIVLPCVLGCFRQQALPDSLH